MNLTASFENILYLFIEAVVRAINEHVDSKNYAVIIARIKVSKKKFETQSLISL